jgi:hypothetical protein
MKGAFLIVGHSQTIEWEFAAQFFDRFSARSVFRGFDLLAYVNSTLVTAGQIERYLELFPNKSKKLLYTPCNGHTVDAALDLNCESNLYKVDTSRNRFGYWYGVIEAVSGTFDLLKTYDWVIQLNPDVYVTDDKLLWTYIETNNDTKFVHHVNTMRGDIKNGFSTDFQLYRPAKFRRNHFLDYRNHALLKGLREKKESISEFRFVPEQLLKHLVTASQEPYQIIGPSTRNNREIDRLGLWHCHDNERVLEKLARA